MGKTEKNEKIGKKEKKEKGGKWEKKEMGINRGEKGKNG